MSTRALHWSVLAVCTVLSVGGILVAAYENDTLDGVRGGAVAVLISLVMLFSTRSHGFLPLAALAAYRTHLRDGNGAATPRTIEDRLKMAEEELDEIMNALRASNDITGRSTFRQNIILAIASGIGTAAWGFGDLAAAAIRVLFIKN